MLLLLLLQLQLLLMVMVMFGLHYLGVRTVETRLTRRDELFAERRQGDQIGEECSLPVSRISVRRKYPSQREPDRRRCGVEGGMRCARLPLSRVFSPLVLMVVLVWWLWWWVLLLLLQLN